MTLFVAVMSEPPSNPHDTHGPAQHSNTLLSICDALNALGHEVNTVNTAQIAQAAVQNNTPWDVVFNLYIGGKRRADQFIGAALLEWAGVAYTGSPPAAHAVALHKHLAKAAWRQLGLKTPQWCLWSPGDDRKWRHLHLPVIVKPGAEGSGLGIDDNSVVRDANAVASACHRLWEQFPGPVLVEEYIEGREFTVGVIPGTSGDTSAQLTGLSPVEIDFGRLPPGRQPIYSGEIKARELATRRCPARASDVVKRKLKELAVQAFEAIGGKGYCRVDFRVDNNDTPWLIEVNTLPGLEPGYSDLPLAAEVAGLSYPQLIGRIVTEGHTRAL